MSDIIERLRNKNWLWTVPGALREEAADEIERLRAALQEIVDSVDTIAKFPPGGYTPEGKLMLIAKRALEQSAPESK
jgi:hypothetical protein